MFKLKISNVLISPSNLSKLIEMIYIGWVPISLQIFLSASQNFIGGYSESILSFGHLFRLLPGIKSCYFALKTTQTTFRTFKRSFRLSSFILKMKIRLFWFHFKLRKAISQNYSRDVPISFWIMAPWIRISRRQTNKIHDEQRYKWLLDL